MTMRPRGVARALVPLLAMAALACASPPTPTPEPVAPTPAAGNATAVAPAGASSFSPPPIVVRPDPSRARGFESAQLSADGRVLTLDAIGGPPYAPDDPCSELLAGWAGLEDGVLVAAVVDVTPPLPSLADGIACDAMGHPHAVRVPLAFRYDGWRLRDAGRAGRVHILRAPDGLLTLRGLPEGWAMVAEGDASSDERPDVPVWRQTWTTDGRETAGPGQPGEIDLYMGFGEATGIVGTAPGHALAVAGHPGVGYLDGTTGELVVVWKVGADGLAIVANATDLTEADILRLAEGVVRR